jgi:hypothetical protein
MTHRFEVGYKERLEQSRKAKNIVRLPRLGYAPYRVYEIKKKNKHGMSKGTLNSMYGSAGTGKSSYTMTVQKSRQSSKTNWQQIIWDYIDAIETLSVPQYEVRWLKSKQATLLRLQGHRVEPTTADDESTVAPVRLGI